MRCLPILFLFAIFALPSHAQPVIEQVPIPPEVRPLLDKLNRILADANPDPAAAALSFGAHVMNELPEDKVIAILDTWGRAMKQKVDLSDNPEDRAFLIGETVTDNLEIKSIPNPILNIPPEPGVPQKRYPEEMFWIHDAVSQRTANHIGLSALYMAMGHRAGITIRPLLMPDHMYLEYSEAGQKYYLEPTFDGDIRTQDDYRRLRPTRAAAHHRPLSLQEYCGLLLTYMGDYYSSLDKAAAARACAETAINWFPDGAGAWVVRALVLRSEGNHPAALACYDRALELDPDDPVAYNNRGNVLSLLGRHADAERSFRRALDIRAEYPNAMKGLADSLNAQGKKQEAVDLTLQYANRALERDPNNHAARFNRANVLSVLGRHAEAEQDFRRVLERNPDNPKAIQGLAASLDVQGKKEEAMNLSLSFTERALEANPNSEAALFNRANIWSMKGKQAEAEQDFRRVLELNPEATKAMQGLAASLDAQGRKDEAMNLSLTFTERALTADPNNELALFNRANILSLKGRHLEAEKDFRRLMEMNPNNLKATQGLAASLDAQGKKDEAINLTLEASNRALEIDPNDEAALFNRANVFALKGQHAEAERDFQRSMELNPENLDAIKGLAASLDAQGKNEEALLLARQLGRRLGTNGELYKKAILALQAGEIKAAKAMIEEFIIREPDDPRGYHALGNIMVGLKKVREGMELYDKALEKDPRHLGSWLGKGKTYLMIGDHAKTENAIRESMWIDPDNLELLHLRAALHMERKEVDQAIPLLEEQLNRAPVEKRQALRRDLAWIYSTSPEAGNPGRAVQLAEHINRLTERKDITDLCLLAAAYNANGQADASEEVLEEAEKTATSTQEQLYILRQLRKLRQLESSTTTSPKPSFLDP